MGDAAGECEHASYDRARADRMTGAAMSRRDFKTSGRARVFPDVSTKDPGGGDSPAGESGIVRKSSMWRLDGNSK